MGGCRGRSGRVGVDRMGVNVEWVTRVLPNYNWYVQVMFCSFLTRLRYSEFLVHFHMLNAFLHVSLAISFDYRTGCFIPCLKPPLFELQAAEADPLDAKILYQI